MMAPGTAADTEERHDDERRERVLRIAAADSRARARRPDLGSRRAASATSSLMCCRQPGLVAAHAGHRLGVLWSSLLVTLLTTLRGLRPGAGRRRRACHPVQPVAAGRIFALSLCRHPAGDAGGRDRAAPADLSAAAGGRAGLRLDRGVLSGAGQHHARAELGRSQSDRAVPALRRLALADPAAT